MKAEFYIVPESFENNTNNSTPELESKIKSLASDFIYIRRYSETNKLFVHPDIYNVNFLKGVLLSDLLYNNEVANQHLDRDVRVSLKRIIIESATTTHTSQEVIDVLLPVHDENICHGLIAFNPVNEVKPEFQIVYQLQGWFDFRRYYLGMYPKSATFYIDECNKYFPNLYFHERNRNTIGAILDNCPKKIVYHLAALNDKFNSFDKRGMNRTQVLSSFSAIASLDETASLVGNPATNANFTFQFRNNDKTMEDVCCEPHLKLCHNDNYPGDNSYSNDRRIYFHEGLATIQNGKILIGHIGLHL